MRKASTAYRWLASKFSTLCLPPSLFRRGCTRWHSSTRKGCGSNVYTDSSRSGAVLPPRRLVRGSSDAGSVVQLDALVSISAWNSKKGQAAPSIESPRRRISSCNVYSSVVLDATANVATILARSSTLGPMCYHSVQVRTTGIAAVTQSVGGGGGTAVIPSFGMGKCEKSSIETQHSHSRVSGGRRTVRKGAQFEPGRYFC